MKIQVRYVVVQVADMQRATAFWRDQVGLELRFASPYWTELDLGNAALALHPADAPGAKTDPEAPGTCRPGFAVDDLDAFHVRMEANGVTVLEAPTLVFGSRVARYADPDGMPFAVGQL